MSTTNTAEGPVQSNDQGTGTQTVSPLKKPADDAENLLHPQGNPKLAFPYSRPGD